MQLEFVNRSRVDWSNLEKCMRVYLQLIKQVSERVEIVDSWPLFRNWITLKQQMKVGVEWHQLVLLSASLLALLHLDRRLGCRLNKPIRIIVHCNNGRIECKGLSKLYAISTCYILLDTTKSFIKTLSTAPSFTCVTASDRGRHMPK